MSTILTFFVLSGCGEKRTPDRYLIPADYEGVLLTVFAQPGFPALPVEDGFLVHRYPKDGILITSSSNGTGWASDEMFDILDDGSLRRLSSGNVADRREHFSGNVTRLVTNDIYFEYQYKMIGSVKYAANFDSKEKDRKFEEAVRKIEALKKKMKTE